MPTARSFRDAIEAVPVELQEDLRSALLALSERLYRIDVGLPGVPSSKFGSDARVVWLDAYVALSASSLHHVLQDLCSLRERLEGLEVGGTTLSSNGRDALDACHAAQRALHAVVDHARAQVAS